MPRGLLFRLIVMGLVALAAYFSFRSEAARGSPPPEPTPAALEPAGRSERSAWGET
jgi:hypothetical protein